MTEISSVLAVAIEAARSAGVIIHDAFVRGSPVVTYKTPHAIVTKTDLAAEEIIISQLQDKFPAHAIFTEERGLTAAPSSEYLWMVDPLDGTTNFAHGIPYFAVSVALLRRGEPVLGVVYEPLRDELFTATVGGGAMLNGQPIHVSSVAALDQAVVVLNRHPSADGKAHYIAILKTVVPKLRSTRSLGAISLDLCYVAAGRLAGFIGNGCLQHDCAAGNLIALEAGALVTDFKGAPFLWSAAASDVLVANNALHPQLVTVLQDT